MDRFASIETGSHLLDTTVLLLGRGEDRVFRPLDGRPAPGIALRAARTLILDAPLAWWFGVLQHEAFGHGGRAREFGSEADVHMGSPWGGRDSYVTFDASGLSTEDLQRVFAAGSESNGWTATLMERDLVAGRRPGSLELLFLVANRLVTSDYVLRTTPDPEREPGRFYREWAGGGDVARWLGYLGRRYRGEPGIGPEGVDPAVVAEFRRLERHAWWNALDPGVWLSLWGVARSVARGGEPPPLPLPRVRGRAFLPVLSADWYPEGGVASLEVVLGPRPGTPGSSGWTSVVLRHGRGPAGALWALGGGRERLLRAGPMLLGGEAEVWQRPGDSLGGGFRALLTGSEGAGRHVFLELGLKSAGHWPGRPAGRGPFLRLGWRLPLDRRYSAPDSRP